MNKMVKFSAKSSQKVLKPEIGGRKRGFRMNNFSGLGIGLELDLITN